MLNARILASAAANKLTCAEFLSTCTRTCRACRATVAAVDSTLVRSEHGSHSHRYDRAALRLAFACSLVIEYRFQRMSHAAFFSVVSLAG